MRTVELTESEWNELMRDWDIWNDESYALHAAYILRDAIKRDNPDLSA